MLRNFGMLWLLVGCLASAAAAATLELVSVDSQGVPGNEHSGVLAELTDELRHSTVTDDGTVFFISHAGLAAGDGNFVADLYRFDTAAGTAAVDVDPAPARGNCVFAATDDTGGVHYLFRRVVFEFSEYVKYAEGTTAFASHSSVHSAEVAGDGTAGVNSRDGAGGRRQIFLRLLGSRTETAVTEDAGANGDSDSPAVSHDGDLLVFASDASNLVAGDENGVSDIYLYDRGAGSFAIVAQRAGARANEDAHSPHISGDGLVVVFASADSGFVQYDTNGKQDVYVVDAGQVERCSVSSTGVEADDHSYSPRLSGTGRFVVFTSTAGNLVSGVDNGRRQVYLYDRDVGRVEALSTAGDGSEADADCFTPEISASGRYVTFVSKATNLVAGMESNTFYQVYRVDRGADFANHPPVAGDVTVYGDREDPVQFSLAATDGDGDPLAYAVTMEAGFVGTLTDAAGDPIVAGQDYVEASFPWTYTPPGGGGVPSTQSFTYTASDGKQASLPATAYLVDPEFGRLTRVSLTTAGAQADSDSYVLEARGLSLSGDGDLVAFTSTANLSPEDDDSGFEADVYVRDRAQNLTFFVSSETAAVKSAYRCVLSGNGEFIAYYTWLNPDRAAVQQLVRKDLDTGELSVIAEFTSTSSNLRAPAVSYDGARIVYEKDGQIYLHDASVARAPVLVSVDKDNPGTGANADCRDVAISADGKVAAFSSTATNLVAEKTRDEQSIFVRFLEHNNLTVVASEDGARAYLNSAAKPALSATGRYVAFIADDNGTTKLFRKNLINGDLTEVASDAANPAMSDDGRFLCYTMASQLYRYDITQDSTLLVSNKQDGTPGGIPGNGTTYQGVPSRTGQFVAFASDAWDLVAADDNSMRDVFVNDLSPPQNVAPTPTLTAINLQEDGSVTDVAITYTDPDNDDVTVDIVSEPAHAAAFELTQIQPGQAFVTLDYTPTAHFFGADSFSYRCGDAAGWSDEVTVNISVNSVNDPPTLAAIIEDPQAIDEGQTLRVLLTVDDPDLQNTQPPAEELSFSVTPSGWGEVVVTGRDGETYVFTPGYDTVARDADPVDQPVTVKVQDLAGETAELTFNLTVRDRNDIPDLTVSGFLELAPGAGQGQITTDLIHIDDADDDAADILVRILQAPDSGTLTDGVRTVLQAGDEISYSDFPLTYVAPADGAGMDTIRIQAIDAAGGSSQEASLNILYGDTALELDVRLGWNVFSLPFTPRQADPAVLFARPGRSGTWYSGILWYWDTLLQSFGPARTLHAGTAYYMYCVDAPDTPIVVEVDGLASVDQSVILSEHWNFVGPLGFGDFAERPLDVRRQPLPAGTIWECSADGCRLPPDGTCARGNAYWIHSFVRQTIEFGLTP